MANTHSTDLESSSSQYWSTTDGSPSGLNITGALTVACWVKFESTTGANQLRSFASKYDQTNQQQWFFGYRQDGANEGLFLQISSGGTQATAQNNRLNWTPSNGTWYHAAITFDPSQGATTRVHFFLDGVNSGTGNDGTPSWPGSMFSGTAPFTVGASYLSTVADRFFDGLINDVRVWSRVLSDTEIGDLYTDGCTFNNGSNLAGWWFTANNGNDMSANGNNLNNNNSATFSTDTAYTCAVVATGVDGRRLQLLGVGN